MPQCHFLYPKPNIIWPGTELGLPWCKDRYGLNQFMFFPYNNWVNSFIVPNFSLLSCDIVFYLLTCSLFNNAVSYSDYSQIGLMRVNNEIKRAWKEVVLSDLFYRNFNGKDCGKIWKTSVRAVSVLAEIWTEHFLKSSQKCHCVVL